MRVHFHTHSPKLHIVFFHLLEDMKKLHDKLKNMYNGDDSVNTSAFMSWLPEVQECTHSRLNPPGELTCAKYHAKNFSEAE